MVPKLCSATSYLKDHDFIPEPICLCGHGATSHGKGVNGDFCSVGHCHGKPHLTQYEKSHREAPTDPTPIGEWEVEFDAKFTDFPAMMSKVEAKYFIKNTLLSQKEQHEKQLQAVREESEKHGETKWGDAKANWQEECREEGRTQERSQIVKLIEAKLDKLTKYGNDRQYGNEWCWTEREVRTILNALKSSKELK